MTTETVLSKDIFSSDLKASMEVWNAIATESSSTIYIRGGALRDSFVNHIYGSNLKIKDVDVMVSSDLISVLAIASKKYGAKIEERNKRKKLPRYSLRFPNSNLASDLSIMQAHPISYDTPRTTEEMLLENARLSNFDVNTLVLGLPDGKFYDPLGAMESIKRKAINLVSEKSLYSNPASILDGLGIAFKTNFQFSDKTKETIRLNASVITKLQVWFLKQKVQSILEHSTSAKLKKELEDLGILEVRPEIADIIDKLEDK